MNRFKTHKEDGFYGKDTLRLTAYDRWALQFRPLACVPCADGKLTVTISNGFGHEIQARHSPAGVPRYPWRPCVSPLHMGFVGVADQHWSSSWIEL